MLINTIVIQRILQQTNISHMVLWNAEPSDLLKVSVTGSYTSNLMKGVTNWAIQRVSSPNCLIKPLHYNIVDSKTI